MSTQDSKVDRFRVSDKAPSEVPSGPCVHHVCIGGMLVIETRSNGQGLYMQYRTGRAARTAAHRAAAVLRNVEVVSLTEGS
jgi:hypothetical protein